jgi:hypothetical protein
VQRVGLQRLARRFARDPVEQACPEEIHHHGNDDHGERRDGGFHHVARLAEQPLAGLPDHDAAQQEQQCRLCERRHALDLAVAVMMLLVGRLAGDADREIGHQRRTEIDQRMGCFRQDRERASEQADNALRQRQSAGRKNGSERNPLLVVLCCHLGSLRECQPGIRYRQHIVRL